MALKAAEKILPSVLVVFLLLSPLLTQSCSAQSTTHEQEKAISFLKDVIQLDMDHYKLTLTGDSMNIDTLRLTYKIEPKAFLSLEKSQTLDFQFYNGSLISFDVQPDSDCLVFTQPRPSRFNATLISLNATRFGLMIRRSAKWLLYSSKSAPSKVPSTL